MLFLSALVAATQYACASPEPPEWERQLRCQPYRYAAATLDTLRVAARRLPLAEAKAALGSHRCATNGLFHYLRHPDSPVVLVYEQNGTFRRPAPLGYYWRASANRDTVARLQGRWRTRGWAVTYSKESGVSYFYSPYVFANVEGNLMELVTLYAPIPVPFEVSRTGGRDRLLANFPEPAEREYFEKHQVLYNAPRTLVWVGPALITFTAGPNWLELSLWTRPAR